MLSGRTLAARFVRRVKIKIVRQNERLERLASLRAAQHAGLVRSNQRLIARARATSGTRTWKSRDFEHVEVGAERKGVRGLEPERRTQNDNLCLQSAREGRTDRLHAGKVGRSRDLPKKEKSRSPQIPLRQNSRTH